MVRSLNQKLTFWLQQGRIPWREFSSVVGAPRGTAIGRTDFGYNDGPKHSDELPFWGRKCHRR